MNNLAMDIANEGTGVTAAVQMWDATESLGQKWALIPEENGNVMLLLATRFILIG